MSREIPVEIDEESILHIPLLRNDNVGTGYSLVSERGRGITRTIDKIFIIN